MPLLDLTGYAAALCTTGAFVPQVLRTAAVIRRGSSHGSFAKPRKMRAAALRDAAPVGPSHRGNYGQIRPAGAEVTRDDRGEWDKVDEASDQSFPASDSPAFYLHGA